MFVYIMHEKREPGIPTRENAATCLEGYRAFGFDPVVLAQALTVSGEVTA